MKRTTTLTLLTVACLMTIPSIAQGRYRDGMNLYEYVRSEPVAGRDPTGRWKLDRNNAQPRAVATAEKGDTVLDLAKKIRLDPYEHHLWMKLTIRTHVPYGSGVLYNELRTVKGTVFSAEQVRAGFPFTILTKICPGETVTIPNEVLAIYGQAKDWNDTYNPASGYSIVVNRIKSELEEWRRNKFKLIELASPTWVAADRALRSENLHAMLFAGHGEPSLPGALVLRNTVWESFRVEGTGEVLKAVKKRGHVLVAGPYVHHRLAEMMLLACSSAAPSREQDNFDPLSIAPRRRGKVSDWEVNVSKYGTFTGYKTDRSGLGLIFGDSVAGDAGGARYTKEGRGKMEKIISDHRKGWQD